MSSVYEHVDHLVTTLVEVGVRCDKIEVKILGFPLQQTEQEARIHNACQQTEVQPEEKNQRLSVFRGLAGGNKGAGWYV